MKQTTTLVREQDLKVNYCYRFWYGIANRNINLNFKLFDAELYFTILHAAFHQW